MRHDSERLRDAMSQEKVLWNVIIPVRSPSTGKTRLSLGAAMNAALATDTVNAVAATDCVTKVLVVTDDASWCEDVAATIVLQRRTGLNGAIRDALEVAGGYPCAVVPGDMPALRATDLNSVLTLPVPKFFVSDRAGTGTVLLASRLAPLTPLFGVGSASRHAAAGFEQVLVQQSSSLQCDVDTLADLAAAVRFGVGSATSTVLRDQGVAA